MKQKFILTDETIVLAENLTLHRIKAVKDFGNIKAGTKGGYVQCVENLSQKGLCWIADDAIAFEFARISENGLLMGAATARGYSRVYGNAVCRDYAVLKDSVHVFDNAVIGSKSFLAGGATASGNARVFCKPLKGEPRYPNIRDYGVITENAQLLQRGIIRDQAVLRGNAILKGCGRLTGRSIATDDVLLSGSVRVMEDAKVFKQTRLFGRTTACGNSLIYGCSIGGRSLITCNAVVSGNEELIDFRISGDQIFRGGTRL